MLDVLSATLAFSLTMFMFSTLVSVLVEAFFHRLFELRQDGFYASMERLFDTYISQRPEFKGEKLQEIKEEFLRHVTRNQEAIPVAKDEKSSLKTAQAAEPPEDDFLSRLKRFFLSGDKVSSLEAVQFVERVAATRVGEIMLKGAGAEIEKKINLLKKLDEKNDEHVPLIRSVEDLAAKFDRFGEIASQYFHDRSKGISLVAAIFMAFAANVEAGRLFQGFLENPQAREAIIAMKEQILNMVPAPESGNGSQKTATFDQEKRRQLLNDMEKKLQELDEKGLTLGDGYFPWCRVIPVARENVNEQSPLRTYDAKKDGRTVYFQAKAVDSACAVVIKEVLKPYICDCLKDPENDPDQCVRDSDNFINYLAALRQDPSNSFRWFLFVLLSGLMIGLGGPFWFRIIDELSNLSQFIKPGSTAGKPTPKQMATDGTGQTTPAPEPDYIPKDVVQAFLLGARSRGEKSE